MKMSNFIPKQTKDESVIDKPKDTLNPRFFNGMKLSRNTRKSFLNLLNSLIKEFSFKNIDQYILEKNFVGSMVSYQWADDSDIDLHIVIDDSSIAEDHNLDTEEVLNILRSIAKQYNDRYYVSGHLVEFYVQAKDEPFYSEGVYDLDYDSWTKNPEIQEYDKEKVSKAKELAKEYKKYILPKVKDINRNYKKYTKNKENEEVIKKLKTYYDFIENEFKSLKDERNKGIRKEGNTSVINMKFKFLSRLGILKQMKEAKKKLESTQFEIN